MNSARIVDRHVMSRSEALAIIDRHMMSRFEAPAIVVRHVMSRFEAPAIIDRHVMSRFEASAIIDRHVMSRSEAPAIVVRPMMSRSGSEPMQRVAQPRHGHPCCNQAVKAFQIVCNAYEEAIWPEECSLKSFKFIPEVGGAVPVKRTHCIQCSGLLAFPRPSEASTWTRNGLGPQRSRAASIR